MEIRADVRIYSGIFLIALAAVGVIIFERIGKSGIGCSVIFFVVRLIFVHQQRPVRNVVAQDVMFQVNKTIITSQ